MDKKSLIILVLIVVIAVITSVTVTTMILLSNNNINSILISSEDVNDQITTNTGYWHKINSYNGVSDDFITINARGNRIKVVSTAMPIKNYAENYMTTTISNNRYNVDSSELSWNDKSAVATKTTNIQFIGSGTHYISISTYELDYWNIEIYEWY